MENIAPMTTIYTDKDRARFHAMVRLSADTDGCHLWTGSTSGGSGYKQGHFRHGKLGVNRKMLRAHRVAWEMANGPIPEDLKVRHICHIPNPLCVNPVHLATGTHAENMDDKYRTLSMNLPDAPLTEAEREYIRAFVDDHGGTVAEAAYNLGGVHKGTVGKGLRLGREAWARLEFTTFLGRDGLPGSA
jgi:hypothetical protein